RPSAAELRRALLLAQARLHSYGVTAWQDAWVGPGLGLSDVLTTYLDAAAAGELTARVQGALWWQRERGLDQLDELRAKRTTVGRFQANAVKMMLDGVAENHTAAMLEPYVGRDTSGLAFIDPDALPGYVTALDREGFSVHFHAIGDRAVRLALDAVAAARASNGWS